MEAGCKLHLGYHKVNFWEDSSAGRLRLQSVLGGSNSVCFPALSADFDLPGSQRLYLGNFTLGWRRQYKVVEPFPSLLPSQGRETHYIGVILSCIFSIGRYFHYLFSCSSQCNHQNKNNPETLRINCFDLTFGEEELGTSLCCSRWDAQRPRHRSSRLQRSTENMNIVRVYQCRFLIFWVLFGCVYIQSSSMNVDCLWLRKKLKWCDSKVAQTEILALAKDFMLCGGNSLYAFQSNLPNF